MPGSYKVKVNNSKYDKGDISISDTLFGRNDADHLEPMLRQSSSSSLVES